VLSTNHLDPNTGFATMNPVFLGTVLSSQPAMMKIMKQAKKP
jgi:hypothetical protein